MFAYNRDDDEEYDDHRDLSFDADQPAFGVSSAWSGSEDEFGVTSTWAAKRAKLAEGSAHFERAAGKGKSSRGKSSKGKGKGPRM